MFDLNAVLEFVDDDGIEDVSVALTYFSDVDCLLGLKRKGPKASSRFILPGLDEIDPGHIAEAVAGSVAARGVLFANTHPAKHRLCTPRLWHWSGFNYAFHPKGVFRLFDSSD